MLSMTPSPNAFGNMKKGASVNGIPKQNKNNPEAAVPNR